MNNDMVKLALSQYGIKEIPGSVDNPQIVKYFSEIGHSWVKDDETAWCSAFVNWVAKQSGHEYTAKLNARSWLNAGIEVSTPQIGDIAVFWRKGRHSAYGHVAIYINEDSNNVYVLGGNQSNQVCIQAYPKSRLLQYRRLNRI